MGALVHRAGPLIRIEEARLAGTAAQIVSLIYTQEVRWRWRAADGTGRVRPDNPFAVRAIQYKNTYS